MDGRQVRQLLDEVCADLDRRRAGMSAVVGRYARPVGFSLALGLGGLAGCGSGSAPHGGDVGVYGVFDTGDLRPPAVDHDGPRVVDAYGVFDIADLRPPAADVYAVSDLAPGDVVEAKGILDSGSDLYGVMKWDAFPRVDAGSIDGGGTDQSKPDAGVSVDSEPADGGAID